MLTHATSRLNLEEITLSEISTNIVWFHLREETGVVESVVIGSRMGAGGEGS